MTMLHGAACFVALSCLQRAEICALWGGEKEESSVMPKKRKKKRKAQSTISCGSEGKMPKRTKINKWTTKNPVSLSFSLSGMKMMWEKPSLKNLHQKVQNKSITRHSNIWRQCLIYLFILFLRDLSPQCRLKEFPCFIFFSPALHSDKC